MTFCDHTPEYDRWDNYACSKCNKMFKKNQYNVPDYVLNRTDADREI